MSEAPTSSCSPLQPPLRHSSELLCSPPAMVSLGSDLHSDRSRPAVAESIIGLMHEDDDDVTLSCVYRSGKYDPGAARGRGGAGSSAHGRAGSATGASGAPGADGSALLSPGSLRRPDSFYMHSGVRGLDESVVMGDMAEYPIQYGPVEANSFARPSSGALTARGGSGHGGLLPSPRTAATARGHSPALEGVGVPQAMLQGPRRPQPPPTPRAIGSASDRHGGRRYSAGGTTPSLATGPDGRPLDSILISSSQITSTTASPSREAAAKRSCRFHGKAEEDAVTPMALPSPSAVGQRKKVSLPANRAPMMGRSIDSVGSSAEALLGVPAAPKLSGPTPKSLHVNLAHKALIGKGSYGMVFKAMNRDTNQLIAVKEIALTGPGGGARACSSLSSGQLGRGSTTAEDVVMDSVNDATGTPSSAAAGAARGGAAARSPMKVGRSADLARRLEAVRRELAVLKQLDHPNIVKCLGEECDDRHLRIYMELVAGGSVSSLLRTFGNFEERQASNFTRQMLEGLRYLHSMGIVHRDLKGDNLLVDTSGTLKLADFGTARDMQAPMQTLPNTIVGTACFMAPEVILGEGADAKADIWSVGCCVVEMLTGLPPMSSMPNQYSIMMLIAEAKDNLLDKYIPADNKWSADALDFVRRCLSRNPDKRPTAQQLLSHHWITHPTQDDTLRSPESTVLATTAVAHTSPQSPLPLDRLRSECSDTVQGGWWPGSVPGSSTATDLESLTPTSERARRSRRDRKGKREKDRERRKTSGSASSAGAGASRGRGKGPEEYDIAEADLVALSGAGAGAGARPGSPRGTVKDRRRGEATRAQSMTQRSGGGGSGGEGSGGLLPDIRSHSSAATSLRSPFLPSLTGDRTPSSAHVVGKSSSSSQRGIFADVGGGRRGGGGRFGSAASAGANASGGRASGSDVGSGKGSYHLMKSPWSSKDVEPPTREQRPDQTVDDVVTSVRDESMRNMAGPSRTLTVASPPQSLKRTKLTASPRIPPLTVPPTRRRDSR